MNRPRKLPPKTPPPPLKPSTSSKKSIPRNPLKELNPPAAASRTSADAQRGGCLRFLLSGSSPVASTSSTSSRTPKSAPPNLRPPPAKPIALSKPRPTRKPGNFTISEEQLKNRLKQHTSNLLPKSNHRRNPRGSGSEVTFQAPAPAPAPALTPEKSQQLEQKQSTTPTSAATPPIEVSVSPEVNASLMTPMPICFAAGHVIAGVQDRRKCRPRGLLTVGGPVVEAETTVVASVPPLVEASIHWLSSPPGSSRSLNCSLSPCENPDWGFGFPSPASETPSSGFELRRTPSSGSSTSPFSAILQRAAAVSAGYRYRYGSIAEEGSAGEALETVRLLSPRPPPASDASFEFGETRISWREGLVSRMFQMGEIETDAFPWMLDEETGEKAEFRFDFECENSKSWGSMVKGGDGELMRGFGSVEFAYDEGGAHGGEGKGSSPAVNPCAESFSTSGGGGLGSSGDSDWTLFYRNNLFEERDCGV